MLTVKIHQYSQIKAISENEEYIIFSIFIFKLKRMKCKRESVSSCRKRN